MWRLAGDQYLFNCRGNDAGSEQKREKFLGEISLFFVHDVVAERSGESASEGILDTGISKGSSERSVRSPETLSRPVPASTIEGPHGHRDGDSHERADEDLGDGMPHPLLDLGEAFATMDG